MKKLFINFLLVYIPFSILSPFFIVWIIFKNDENSLVLWLKIILIVLSLMSLYYLNKWCDNEKIKSDLK